MHPTDHYTALGWALRDASNYICLCCLFWFGLRRTGWQSFIARERYRDNRGGAAEPKWKWRPVMIIIDIVINHHQSWSDWSHNHHQFYYFCRRSNWHHRQHRQDKGWTAKLDNFFVIISLSSNFFEIEGKSFRHLNMTRMTSVLWLTTDFRISDALGSADGGHHRWEASG